MGIPTGSLDWKKMVMVKDAEYLGKSCTDFEKNGEDLYTFRSDPVFLGCDYFTNY